MNHELDSLSDGRVVVIGGGPAGLTAAYELGKRDIQPIVIEKRDKVGGIARTENYKGYYFDMGGHRFFTKSDEVNRMWHEVLGEAFMCRPRLSRIYYKKKFFSYPIKPFNALMGLGPIEGFLIALSYARWQLFPYREEQSFEQWVTNRFGKRLFETFFKSYTEKVWGIPCSELRAEWAAQRIKGLSLTTALLSMFLKSQGQITTLIEEFHYPRHGPGEMWGEVARRIVEQGGAILLNTDVVRVQRDGNRITGLVVSCDGEERTIHGSHFISSMPIRQFIERLEPQPSETLPSAQRLKYRDFLTVCLVVDRSSLFPDNWIYVHDAEVKVGRIQNFKNWSPYMVPDPETSSLGLEYFCTEGDEIWTMPDADLIELGKREVDRIGLARYDEVTDGCVFRVEKAYPVYDADYAEDLAEVRSFVDGLENFQTIGRNGLHRYNNQDHAMLTGMLGVRNLVNGEHHDIWSVNTEQEYHEEIHRPDQKAADVAGAVEEVLVRTLRRLDPVALGLSFGLTASLLLFLATLILVLKGGNVVGPNLGLLAQFLPGYSVSWAGSLLGLLYGFVAGFIAGWGFAQLRSLSIFLSIVVTERRVELQLLEKLFE